MDNVIFDVISRSAGETAELGARLGRLIAGSGEKDVFIALYGNLGAGKTAFVSGLASEITPGAPVCSPTYSVVNEYAGGGRKMYHFDMYRITSDDDLFSVGFYDYGGIIAAEWCENIPFALPEKRVDVKISREDGENVRRVSAVLVGKTEEKAC